MAGTRGITSLNNASYKVMLWVQGGCGILSLKKAAIERR
jgi:hypothetical protein